MFNTRFIPLRTAALCACLLSPALLCGCGGGSSSATSNNPVTSTPRSSNGLQFTLSANKSAYAVGETVQFTLAVKNTSAQPVIIGAPSSGDDRVFQLLQNNQVVWSSLEGGTTGSIGDISPTFTITVGQTLTLSNTWNQQSDVTGQQAAPGTYQVHAYFAIPSINGTTFTTDQAQAALSANPIQITLRN